MSAKDIDAITLVEHLVHRVSSRQSCRCEECRAIKHTATLAREAVAMKAARKRTKKEAK